MDKNFNKQTAFTLIELLVIVGIIGILSAIGVVGFGAVREKARRGACIATLRSNFNSDENLVAYWNFDEQGPGNIASTAAGAIKDFWGHNGTVTGNPVYQDGIIDSALNFDGNDYVYIGSEASLNITTGAITIEAWVKTVAFGNNQYRGIVGRRSGAITDGCGFHYGLSSYWGAGNQLEFWVHKEGVTDCNNLNYVVSPNLIELGKWYHVVGTYDSTSGIQRLYLSGIQRLYLNGNKTESNKGAGTKIRSFSTNQPTQIGSNPQGFWYFNGLIDEPIIYNRALSANEIASHYKACKK